MDLGSMRAIVGVQIQGRNCHTPDENHVSLPCLLTYPSLLVSLIFCHLIVCLLTLLDISILHMLIEVVEAD